MVNDGTPSTLLDLFKYYRKATNPVTKWSYKQCIIDRIKKLPSFLKVFCNIILFLIVWEYKHDK